MSKKLTILFRVCNKELKKEEFNVSRPYWFDKRRCLFSFFQNFSNRENVNIIVIFDGKPDEELSQYIIKNFRIDRIHHLYNVGNKESLIYCYNLAKELEFDYVFFAEDDYLYLQNSYNIMIEGLESVGDQAFITLYGHLNRYLPPDKTGDVTFGKEYILLSKSSFWRSEDSTTGSVAMTKNMFNIVKDDLIKHNVSDCAFYREQYLQYNRRVFSCLPPKSTHVNRFFASPMINWEEYNNSVIL